MTNTFTPTELRQNSAEVFNEVQRLGWSKIKSKSRPDMVLMTQRYLDEMLLQAKEGAKD